MSKNNEENGPNNITVKELVNPHPMTKFQDKLQELSEAVYRSDKRAPLGRSRFRTRDDRIYGLKVHRDYNLQEIMYPSKNAEPEEEDPELHKALILSHKSYYVGERIDRKYNSGHFCSDKKFGMPTPHHNDGRSVLDTLCWQGETSKERKEAEKMKMKLLASDGSPARGFGNSTRADEFGAGEVIHCTEPGQYVRGPEPHISLVNALRHDLKRLNFHNFSSLLEAFKSYDKKEKGLIDKADLEEVCRKFNLNASEPVIKDLIEYCDTDKDGQINFVEFANYLNWKDMMPIKPDDGYILTNALQTDADPDNRGKQTEAQPQGLPGSQALVKPEDLEPFKPESSLKTVKRLPLPRTNREQFITTSSYIGSFINCPPPESVVKRTYGLPSQRFDKQPPRIRSVSDFTNYGDKTTAGDLIYPSVFAKHGVYMEHLQCPCTKDEAGKRIPAGDTVEMCLQETTPTIPPVVKKFSVQPALGAPRRHPGRANDPDVASTLVHGIRTTPSLSTEGLLNPPPKTWFQEKLQEHREAVYRSNRRAPLGRSRLQPSPNDNITYGIKTERGCNAGELISPPLTAEEVHNEAHRSHKNRVLSHNSYFVGEQIDRNYDPRYFSKDITFGKRTPHHNDGCDVGKTLLWLDGTK